MYELNIDVTESKFEVSTLSATCNVKLEVPVFYRFSFQEISVD